MGIRHHSCRPWTCAQNKRARTPCTGPRLCVMAIPWNRGDFRFGDVACVPRAWRGRPWPEGSHKHDLEAAAPRHVTTRRDHPRSRGQWPLRYEVGGEIFAMDLDPRPVGGEQAHIMDDHHGRPGWHHAGQSRNEILGTHTVPADARTGTSPLSADPRGRSCLRAEPAPRPLRHRPPRPQPPPVTPGCCHAPGS
jgi:hypothetical protein